MDQALLELIEMLKELSPILWATLVRQAQIDGITNLVWAGIWGLLAAINLVLVCPRLRKAYQESKEDWQDYWWDNGWGIAAVFSYLASAVPLLIMLLDISMGIRWLVNPEFFALRYLLQQIGQ